MLVQSIFCLFVISHVVECSSNYWRYPKAHFLHGQSNAYLFPVASPGCHNFWLKADSTAQLEILDPELGTINLFSVLDGWNLYARNISIFQPADIIIRLFGTTLALTEVFLGPCGINSPATFSGSRQ
jgi:hypothetical protein